MEHQYNWDSLQKLEKEQETGRGYIEAYSDLGHLTVKEKEAEVQFVWETDSDFRDVLEAVEMFYRRKNGIQALNKDNTGNMSYEKIRDYVLEGPLRNGEVADWKDYAWIEIGGDDFYVSWRPDSVDSNKVRLATSGSGVLPFASTYSNTVDGDTQEVIDEIENEFFDHPHNFPGYWNPRDGFE